MKGRRAHVVPLSGVARRIILRQLSQKTELDEFVFASRFLSKQRIARHSLSQALRRIISGLRPNTRAAKSLQFNPPTPHDFRRTLATRTRGVRRIREDRLALLAHTWGDVHEAHYDRYERLKEKRYALELWAERLAALIDGAPTAAVVPLRGR